MSLRCCPEAYPPSMRPCPRCGGFVCHKCGVASRGALVCRKCEHAPDPVREEGRVDFGELFALTRLPAALAGGVAGALVGAVVWAGIAAVSGFGTAVIGIVTGVGARFGVWVGTRTRAGCAWPVVAAGVTPVGWLAGRWLVSAALVRAAGGDASLFGGEVGRRILSAWSGLPLAAELACLVLAMAVAALVRPRGF